MSKQRNHSPKKDVSHVSEIDWARLAAYLDGEGSISIAYATHKDPKFEGARRQYEYIRLTIANTDPRLIEWLVETFGGKIRARQYESRRPTWKPGFWWTSSCQRAAELLRHALPYFILKKERAELALALQATMSRCGRRGTPQSVIDQRTAIKAKLHLLNAKGPAAVNE